VYNPGNNPDSILALDFSSYPNFFKDLKELYDEIFGINELRSKNFSQNSMSLDSYGGKLAVHKVGDYKFSIMPSKNDFSKLDQSQLNVAPGALTSINVHSMDYSFLVCQFNGSGTVSPFGYVSKRVPNDKMIIPTIHGHPESDQDLDLKEEPISFSGFTIGNQFTHPNQINSFTSMDRMFAPNKSIDKNKSHNKSHATGVFDEVGDFDHSIYIMAKFNPEHKTNLSNTHYVKFDSMLNKVERDHKQREVKLFLVKGCNPYKKELVGDFKNRNMIVGGPNSLSFYKDLIHDQ